MLVDVVENSTAYLWNLQRGDRLAARLVLLRLGRNKFGDPSIETLLALDERWTLDQIDGLILRLPAVNSWQELLAEP